MIRNWYNQIPHPALKTKREITKYINWRVQLTRRCTWSLVSDSTWERFNHISHAFYVQHKRRGRFAAQRRWKGKNWKGKISYSEADNYYNIITTTVMSDPFRPDEDKPFRYICTWTVLAENISAELLEAKSKGDLLMKNFVKKNDWLKRK